MAWVAVTKHDTEIISDDKPERKGYIERSLSYWYCGSGSMYDTEHMNLIVELPKGSIFKLIGRNLTWDDEPVEIS